YEDAVLVIDFGDDRPIVLDRNGHRQNGTNNQFDNEDRHPRGPNLHDQPFKLGRVPSAAPLQMTKVQTPILVGDRNMKKPSQPQNVKLPQQLLTTNVENPDRIAIIRASPTDNRDPQRLTAGKIIRARHLHHGLNGLTPTAY